METRNTPVLREIIEVRSPQFADALHALDRLEAHCHHRLIVDDGNAATVSAHAELLRLNITVAEIWSNKLRRKRTR